MSCDAALACFDFAPIQNLHKEIDVSKVTQRFILKINLGRDP
jgi:hypothetical protein